MLNTYVVAASLINAEQPISDLKVPVVIMLHHLNTKTVSVHQLTHLLSITVMYVHMYSMFIRYSLVTLCIFTAWKRRSVCVLELQHERWVFITVVAAV